MGAYKRDVVVVIKMGAYIHGVLIFYGCLLSRFYGISLAHIIMQTAIIWPCEIFHHSGQFFLDVLIK